MPSRVLALSVFLVIVSQPLFAQASVSAQNSLEYLRRAMDQFHDRFPVYDDVSSAGNHFHAYAKIPNENAPVDINGSWTDNPQSGATAIRCQFNASPGAFGGFYFQNGTLAGEQTAPQPNFGDVPNAGIDLTGAVALTFWARGAAGGEQVEFFVAGVGRDASTGAPTKPYPDSSPRRPAEGTIYTLSTGWQQFTIDLTGMDLSYVLGGFGWVASAALNPAGATFYLDGIQYELGPSRLAQRLNEPRFIRSFTTLPLQPDPFDGVKDGDIDFVLRNIAFTYDNALAILAFLADSSADGVRRARLIGDALVYASQHDRTFNDDRACNQPVDPLTVDGARMRSAYAGGDLALPPGWTPKGRSGTVPIPGFYAESTKTFYEVEQQAIDTGNNAWAMIALLALYRRTAEPSYLATACKIGNFIRAFRNDSGTYQGFTGGIQDPDVASRSRRPWASSEHNLDVRAAFALMYRVTGDAQWQQDADHAADFVASMWDTGRNCFLAGTVDPSTRNTGAGMLPVDVQAWSVLALPGVLAAHPQVLGCAETNHLNTHDSFTGFDFNEDRDGVWFEGTAQMATAYARAGAGAPETYRQELRRAQTTDPFGDGYGIAATAHDGLTTGFLTAGGDPFKYFRRLHAGATAWNVFAQLSLNPYYSYFLSVAVSGNGSVSSSPAAVLCPSACSNVYYDGAALSLSATAAGGWTFAGWSGDCSGMTSPCPLAMNADRSIAATFVSLPLPPPANLDARYNGSAASISWTAIPGAARYEVSRSSDGHTFAVVATPTAANTTDGGVTPGAAYLYRVRAQASGGSYSGWSGLDVMTAMAFSDDPLVAGSTLIRAAHVLQLRSAVNAVRMLAGLSAATFTSLATGSLVRMVYVTELRNALAPARSALALPALSFAHPALSIVSAIDSMELRDGVR